MATSNTLECRGIANNTSGGTVSMPPMLVSAVVHERLRLRALAQHAFLGCIRAWLMLNNTVSPSYV